MMNYFGMPIQASAHAAEIDQMTSLVHWLMLVLFIGWGLYFVFVVFRFRRGANPRASYVGAKGKISKGTEVGVANSHRVSARNSFKGISPGSSTACRQEAAALNERT